MAGSERVEFPGSRGTPLAGTLHTPEGEARGGVLLAHCFTCSKDLAIMTRLANALAEGGYTVLRFDFTGLGASGGDFTDTSFVTDVGDLVRAALWMIDRGRGPCAMVGHSLGGAATLVAAAKIHPVKSVAVIGAPADPEHVRHLIDEEATALVAAEGCAVADIGGRPFPISRRFLADLEHYDQAGAIAGLGKPLLVLHSPDDTIVPVAEGERIFSLAAQPKAFAPLPGADHLLSDPGATALAAHLLRDWLDRTV